MLKWYNLGGTYNMKNSNTLMVYVECDEFAPINVSLEALSKGVELGKTNNLDVNLTDRKSVV